MRERGEGGVRESVLCLCLCLVYVYVYAGVLRERSGSTPGVLPQGPVCGGAGCRGLQAVAGPLVALAGPWAVSGRIQVATE